MENSHDNQVVANMMAFVKAEHDLGWKRGWEAGQTSLAMKIQDLDKAVCETAART